MCGIAGFTGVGDEQRAHTLIRAMTHRLAHRGPDAEGHWVKPGVAFGHRRLSIIDLSEGANQPFSDPSGRYTITYNGEIYNYQDIRTELKGYEFRTNSDTEVVLAAFVRWGADCLKRFNGMFAFAIWDSEKSRLFVARDRLGIKPFYYAMTGSVFVFASELRALIASDLCERRINQSALVDYLTYQSIPAPHTLIHGVHQLEAGACGFVDRGQLTKKVYWSLLDAPIQTDISRETALRDTKELLLRAVERRMISDVPLGAFLSGGIDSSAIVALMAEVSTSPISTFSIGFGDPKYDESQYAELVAKKYRTQHTALRLDPKECLASLPEALEAMDHPSGDGINTFMVSRATRNAGITVALSGLGGDELFAGYPVFQQFLKIQGLQAAWRIPRFLRSALGQSLRGVLGKRSERVRQLVSAESFRFDSIYPVFRRLYSPEQMKGLSARLPYAHNTLESQFEDFIEGIEKFPLLSQVSIGEIHSYARNVLLKDTDQMSMAHALEVRVPFFDHTLVEYMLGIPDSIKYPRYPKSFLVEALSPRVPDEIVHRPKMGFSFPWETWMRSELKDFCEQRIERLAGRDIFEGAPMRSLWDRFVGGDRNVSWMQVWLLVVLEDWLGNHFDASSEPVRIAG